MVENLPSSTITLVQTAKRKIHCHLLELRFYSEKKDIHFWNKKEFGKGYKNDLALVEAPIPLPIASPNKAATLHL